jgi:hypothetical protein
MAKPPSRKLQNSPARTWVPTLVTCVSWAAVTLSALVRLRGEPGLLVFGLGLTGLAVNLFVARWAERRRWVEPLHRPSTQVAALAEDPKQLSL